MRCSRIWGKKRGHRSATWVTVSERGSRGRSPHLGRFAAGTWVGRPWMGRASPRAAHQLNFGEDCLHRCAAARKAVSCSGQSCNVGWVKVGARRPDHSMEDPVGPARTEPDHPEVQKARQQGLPPNRPDATDDRRSENATTQTGLPSTNSCSANSLGSGIIIEDQPRSVFSLSSAAERGPGRGGRSCFDSRGTVRCEAITRRLFIQSPLDL